MTSPVITAKTDMHTHWPNANDVAKWSSPYSCS